MGVIIGTIFSAIFNIFLSIIKLAAKIFKKILIVTRLIVPFTYAAVFALLFLFDVIKNNELNMILVIAGGVIITFYVYYRMIKKVLKKKSKPETNTTCQLHIENSMEKPRIYRVKQDPQYIMYEYSDRVELYKETEKGLLYIRTDMKKKT